ncbi:MAG: bifunctional DNA-formamidopyrimidine glycosylase/DNA-(apurinic or apyrimidinic site) lyase, partial [Calditrichaeota bacterium]
MQGESMPELPEVETIRRGLSKHLPGRTIQRVTVREARLRRPVNTHKLDELVAGARVARIRRRAKYLLIELQSEATLIVHLGMSGSLLLLTEARPVEKHDHVIFHLDHGWELRFRDPRRFGLVDAVRTREVRTYPRFVHLGLEPLSARTKPDVLFDKAQRSTRPIKNLLMDGTFLVGVGNIYANEALFHAGIHPARPAGSLTASDWQRLLEQ